MANQMNDGDGYFAENIVIDPGSFSLDGLVDDDEKKKIKERK